jgi:hypothetical protein
LVATQVKVAPDALAVAVLGAFPIAFRTSTGYFPLEAYIDAFALRIEPGLRDVPRILDAQQPSKQLGISHSIHYAGNPISS